MIYYVGMLVFRGNHNLLFIVTDKGRPKAEIGIRNNIILKHRHHNKLDFGIANVLHIVNVIVSDAVVVAAIHVVAEIIDTPRNIVREYDNLLFIRKSHRILVITH